MHMPCSELLEGLEAQVKEQQEKNLKEEETTDHEHDGNKAF